MNNTQQGYYDNYDVSRIFHNYDEVYKPINCRLLCNGEAPAAGMTLIYNSKYVPVFQAFPIYVEPREEEMLPPPILRAPRVVESRSPPPSAMLHREYSTPSGRSSRTHSYRERATSADWRTEQRKEKSRRGCC
eukprot:Trichotokara_eunicae@DN2147_c0_g1_i1.p1